MMIRSLRPSRRHLLAGAAAVLLLPVLRFGIAGTGGDAAAEAVIARLVERVARALAEAGTDEGAVAASLAAAIDQETNFPLLARLVLGHNWRAAAPEQRAQYEALFRAYMLRTFARRLHDYAGADPADVRQRFVILGSEPAGGRDALVHSRLTPPGRPPLRVDWRVRKGDGQPAVIDLIVEGVSLLVTQRAEFAAVVERAGLDGLIAELRTRLAPST